MLRSSLNLLKASLFHEQVQIPSDTNWNEVFRELTYQTVAALAVDWTKENLDENIAVRWDNFAARQVILFYQLLSVQSTIDELFKENRVPYVILKGAAAGQYYPRPERRAYGDIDILVPPEAFEQAEKLLLGIGSEITEDGERHVAFTYNYVDIELHHYFSDNRENEIDRAFDQKLFEAIPQASICMIQDSTFYCLPKLENGLVLLYHIKHHLNTGLGLRQIIDWMMYVNREVDNDYWKTTFEPAARSFGLDRLAVTVTRMCQIYLRLPDRITWCKDADEEICREVMDHISEHGNFGVKDRKDSKQTMQVLLDGNIFMRLQRQGLVHWKAAEEHSFLKPFAWLYQICRYIHLGFKREKPIASLIRDIKDSRHRKKLYRELGI